MNISTFGLWAPRLSALADSLHVERFPICDGDRVWCFTWECEMLEHHGAQVESYYGIGFYGRIWGCGFETLLFRPTLRAWWYAAWTHVCCIHRHRCNSDERDYERWADEQADKLIRAGRFTPRQTRHDGAGRTQSDDRA